MSKLSESQDVLQMVVQRAREHLVDFEIATNPRYEPNWHHEQVAKELEHIELHGDKDYKFLLVLVPPRHGKSQQCSTDFPAWFLGRNPLKEIITASYSGELAQDFGGKTRELVASEAYQAIFEVKLRPDEQSKAKWKTKEGGSYTSVGVGGATTGRGANILVIDDPIKNREEAESEVYRQKTWDWFTSTAFTRLEPRGVVIIILTRWHVDDLAGRILSNEELAPRTKVIRFPAIAEQDEEHRKEGEALWPERFDLEAIEEIRKVTGPYDFAALYQQTPIVSADQEFKDGWIHYRSWQEVEALDTRKFATIDPGGKEADSDYTGIVRNYVDKENKWNIKAMRVRFDSAELVNYLFVLHDEGFEKIGVEETVYLRAIEPFFKEECRRRNKFPVIEPLKHHMTQKEVRIRGLIPRYSAGGIFHIEGDCKDLEDEMRVFPKGAHDDTIDALAYQNEIAESPDNGYTQTLRILETRQNKKRNSFR